MEIRALHESDDRSLFHSGDPDLDRFFHDFAGQVVTLDRATGALRSVTRPAGSLVDAGTDGRVVVTAVGALVARRFEARPVA